MLIIEDHTDVARWMDRCAVSDAPAVIAIFSQSKTRAFGRAWQPAVRTKTKPIKVFDLKPAEAVLPELEEVLDAKGKRMAYRVKASGGFLMKDDIESTFFCPDCGTVVEAEPGTLRKRQGTAASAEAKSDAESRQEPVRSLTWFEDKRRRCAHCGSPLWTDARITATRAKYPQRPFNVWSRAIDAGAGRETSGEPSTDTPKARTYKLPRPQVRIVDADGTRGPAAPDSFSPYDYWRRFYKGICAFVEIDESHNLRGQSTDIAHSGHLAQLASQNYGYGSGTHYGGVLTDFFSYWYCFNPRFWRRLGLGWNDAEQAMSAMVWFRRLRKSSSPARGAAAAKPT